MDSAPPAMTISESPSAISCQPETTACIPELHWRWMVKPVVSLGIPAFSATVLPRFGSSVRWMQFPRITSSTSSGERSARFMASCTATMANSLARSRLNCPPKSPIGVLAPARMTTSFTFYSPFPINYLYFLGNSQASLHTVFRPGGFLFSSRISRQLTGDGTVTMNAGFTDTHCTALLRQAV